LLQGVASSYKFPSDSFAEQKSVFSFKSAAFQALHANLNSNRNELHTLANQIYDKLTYELVPFVTNTREGHRLLKDSIQDHVNVADTDLFTQFTILDQSFDQDTVLFEDLKVRTSQMVASMRTFADSNVFDKNEDVIASISEWLVYISSEINRQV
jgi:hypothetical protein